MTRRFLAMAALVCLTSTAAYVAADAPKDSRSKTATKKSAKEKEARIISSVDVDPADTKLTAAESREVSFAAGRILKHVAQARSAIANKKLDDAKTHVDQGLKLVAIINNVMPHYTVKTEIKSGKLVYQDVDDVAPQYVTVFDELEHRNVVAPISTAKQEAEQKGDASKKGDAKKKGEKVSDSTDRAPLVVRHADIDYSALKLNLHLANRMLHEAQNQLADNKAEDANLALLTLQASGVVLEYDEIDLPLEEAADNLKIAETEIKAGRPQAATAALHVAIDELKSYESTVGENRGKEVKKLHEEINKLTVELVKGKLTPKAVEEHASTISKWWDKVTSWFKKS